MPCAPQRAARGRSPAARSWHCGGSGTVSQRSHLPLPASAPRTPKPALEGLHDAQRTPPEREGSAGDAGNERPRPPPTPYPPERKGCSPRNFPAPTRRAREAQLCAARLPALSPARRDRAAATQAASSRTAAAARTAYPDVPAASCAPGRGSPASPDLLRDLGIAAGPPRGASEDIGAAAEPLESYGVPLACSLGAIWLHVLVTHQEGCAPRGSRRTHTASARPAQPPPAQRTALRPGPPSARPTPAPPPAETPAPAHNRGGKTLARSGVGCPSPESPQAEDLGRPTRQFQVPSTQSRSPSCPPSLSNFPFSSSDRSDPLPGFPPAKTGAGSPLPVALLWGRAPLPEQRPAAGLDLPTRNLGQACH